MDEWERGANESLKFQDGYDSFWSHCEERRGYCGVATYTRNGFLKKATIGFCSETIGAEEEILKDEKNNREKKKNDKDGDDGYDDININNNNNNNNNNDNFDKKESNSNSISTKSNSISTKSNSISKSSSSSFSFDPLFQRAGRVLVTDHGAFVLFNCYFPNTGRMGASIDTKKCFQRRIETQVRALLAAGREVVVIGDLNIVPEPIDTHDAASLERAETSCVLPCERDWLHSLLHGERACLHDAFRVLHPDARHNYTFWEQRTLKRQTNRGLRIDAALISQGLKDRLLAVTHHHSIKGR